MSTLSEVRTALRDTLKQALDGVEVYRAIPEQVNVPAVVVHPEDADLSKSMRQRTKQWSFEVIAFVGRTATDDAHDLLDELVSENIPETLRSNPSFGLPDVDSFVTGIKDHERQSDTHISSTVSVTVVITG